MHTLIAVKNLVLPRGNSDYIGPRPSRPNLPRPNFCREIGLGGHTPTPLPCRGADARRRKNPAPSLTDANGPRTEASHSVSFVRCTTLRRSSLRHDIL